jgi:hypothetical protein
LSPYIAQRRNLSLPALALAISLSSAVAVFESLADFNLMR